ncbi:MAG: Asp-tRNA(Asn)/Glu-tRNA(Gln) amidotransferase subunit GatC [Coriobacteriales bacterium]|nr:Asp-tRNA(Asn)/Glu-tRNA(Gln) amidotransferase subunit GatC [Coriobacteriales bacterium]
MALTKDDVRGIADYARIALTEQELDQMHAYLNEAIQMLEPIRQYDLDGVEPTFHPIGGLRNVMADDQPDANGRALGVDEVLRNAAVRQGRLFCVPSILGVCLEENDGAS